MKNPSSSKKSNDYYYDYSEAVARLEKFRKKSMKTTKVDVLSNQVRLNSLEKSKMRKSILLSLSGLALFLAACPSVA